MGFVGNVDASPLLNELTFGKYNPLLYPQSVHQLASSWQYTNQDYDLELQSGLGIGQIYAIWEDQKCTGGSLRDGVHELHPVFQDMDIIHWAPPQNIWFTTHVTKVASQFSYFEPNDPEYDIVPEIRLLVANPCNSSEELRAMSWLNQSNVRLLSRSTFQVGFSGCGLETIQSAQSRDDWARKHDIVMTVAAGQSGSCDHHLQENSTICRQGNALCIGGTFDTNRKNMLSSGDLVDDFFPDTNNDEDGVNPMERFAYKNGGFINGDRLDRERPHLVAEVVGAVPGTTEHLSEAMGWGTSLASPRALASIGESLEFMQGAHWTKCRISEWTRAVSIFSAWRHSVFPYRFELGNLQHTRKRTAYHDLPISESPGLAGGSFCVWPNDCDRESHSRLYRVA